MRVDLTGRQFTRLTAIEYVRYADSRNKWRCICICDNFVFVLGSSLKNGNTRSCGCLHREQMSLRFKKHGKRHTTEYSTWCDMIKRCENPRHKMFKYYGGRGIRVCRRWRASFSNFIEDVGVRPSLKHSLDRYPNKNGAYGPKNFRWATAREQAQNMRRNRFLTAHGVTLCISEWARRIGLNESSIRGRLERGATDVEAVKVRRTACA